LPIRVSGSSARNSISRGHDHLMSRARQCSTSSEARALPATADSYFAVSSF
jgi:hypothetical protein